jgi:hypothetical protein
LILKPSQKVLDFDIKTFTEDRRYWTLILKPSQKTEGISKSNALCEGFNIKVQYLLSSVKVLISKSNTFCEGFNIKVQYLLSSVKVYRKYWTLILKPSQKVLDFDIKTFTECIRL